VFEVRRNGAKVKGRPGSVVQRLDNKAVHEVTSLRRKSNRSILAQKGQDGFECQRPVRSPQIGLSGGRMLERVSEDAAIAILDEDPLGDGGEHVGVGRCAECRADIALTHSPRKEVVYVQSAQIRSAVARRCPRMAIFGIEPTIFNVSPI
jgi:hypothetical protein